LQNKIFERKKDSLNKNKILNDEALKKLKLKMFQIEIDVIAENENRIKIQLKKLRNTIEKDINEIIQEEKHQEYFKKCMETQSNNNMDSGDDDNFEDANDNEDEFYDAVQINKSIKEVDKMLKKDNSEGLKKDLLDYSRKKCLIRNKMVDYESII
jgi:hypothetical protein